MTGTAGHEENYSTPRTFSAKTIEGGMIRSLHVLPERARRDAALGAGGPTNWLRTVPGDS